jgi:helicase
MFATAAEIAEILHPGLDLADRVGRLVVRLDLGISAAAVNLGWQARSQLSRSDYSRLVAAHLVAAADIKAADDAAILNCVSNDRAKLAIIREGAEAMSEQDRRRAAQKSPPILEPYVA